MPDIITEVNAYLSNPTPANRQALLSAGTDIIPVGLVTIAERLREVTRETLINPLLMDEKGDHWIQASGIKWLSAFQEIIVQFGAGGLERLLRLLAQQDADIQALAALEIATKDLTYPLAYQPLSQAFQRARGTSLRLALAIALLMQGDLDPFKACAHPYLIEREEVRGFLTFMEQKDSNFNQKEFEMAFYKRAAFPRGLGLVVWDIGTNGLGPKDLWPEWRRRN